MAGTIPPIADAPSYRGDNTRTAVMPGPGPNGRPIELWRHDSASGYTPEPVVVGGQLIAVSDTGEITALDMVTGRESGGFDLGAGVVSNPAAGAGTIFVVTQDGVLHAVSHETWTERWHQPGYDPVTQIAVSDDTVMAGAPRALVARRASDGAETWSVPVAAAARIAVRSDRAYVSGSGSDAVTEIDIARHLVVRELHTGGGEVLTPAAVDDGVIVGYRDRVGGANGVQAFDADGNLRWRFAEPNGDRLDAVVVDKDTIFVYCGDAGIVDLVDPANGKLRGESHRLDEPGLGNPAVADGLIYLVGQRTGLFAMDAEGKIAWQVPFDGASGPARLVITGGIVIVPMTGAGSTGSIVAFIDPADPRAPHGSPVAGGSESPTIRPSPMTRVVQVLPTNPDGFVAVPALAPDGTLFAIDAFADQVVAFGPDGSTRAWGSKGSGRGELDFSLVTRDDAAMGIAVSPDGQLIAVGEAGNSRVQLFDPSGTSLHRFGRTGRGDGQFVNPTGLAVDSEDRIWVVDTARADVQVFDVNGKFLLNSVARAAGLGSYGARDPRSFVRMPTRC